MYIDTHVHFDRFAQDGTLPDVLRRAKEAGVHEMVAVGGSSSANALALRLAAEHPGRVFACAGYDRDEAPKDPDLPGLRLLLADPLVKAVGETGLDYHYSADTAARQKKLFAENLALAAEFSKPVVVHSREADEDTLALLRDFAAAWKGAGPPGVLHCFTRGAAFARQVLDLGFLVGFSGILTFANAGPLREVAAYVPEDRLLVETDSPYLAPAPLRGRCNEPAWVVHVAKQLAEARGCPLGYAANLTARNARALFALQ